VLKLGSLALSRPEERVVRSRPPQRSVRSARSVGALGARGSKPFAYVVFHDGTLHQNDLKDKRVAARAQADALRFNALAANKTLEDY
jgi:hypothetical protein